MNFMDENAQKPSILRLAAAVILGIIVGSILFFVVALFIGMFNSLSGMNIPLRTDVTEDVLSAILLVVFIGLSITGFCWKVWTTPVTEESTGPEPDN
jgi:uncharacterized protein YqhQ